MLYFLEQFSICVRDFNSQVFFLVFLFVWGSRGRMLFIEPYGNVIKAVDLVFLKKTIYGPQVAKPHSGVF